MHTCRNLLGSRRRRTTAATTNSSTHKEEEEEEKATPHIPYPTDPNSYLLLQEIGRGMSAVVYKAACLPLASLPVAIKSINLDRTPARACALNDVRREAKTMSLFSHPNVLRSHCSFAAGRCLWVVMPFMSAGSLQSILSSTFPAGLPEPAVAYVLRDVLRALSYLHAQGYVHRDIKAGNILVGGDGSVKLADFGVSASIYDGLNSSSSSFSLLREIAGTPYWMAPEVIHSHVGYGIKADIWSFGITALELAYGRPPLSHLPPSKCLLVRVTSRLWLDDAQKYYNGKKKLSNAFREMVAACLSQDPSNRPSADKLLRHPFFKNCRSKDYLVKNILRIVRPVEERFNSSPETDDDDGISTPKSRRVSGWNFCEDRLEMVVESLNHEDGKKKVSGDQEVGQPKKMMAPAYNNELLVPKLVSLIGSLERQREMVVNVFESCGGAMEVCHEEREKVMSEFVKFLQKTVDDLSVELQREKSKNSELQEELERLVGGMQ